jgi:hypothetical protein
MPIIYIYPPHPHRPGDLRHDRRSLFQLNLHDGTGLVGTTFRDRQITPRHLPFSLHDLPDRSHGIYDCRTRRIGHEGSDHFQPAFPVGFAAAPTAATLPNKAREENDAGNNDLMWNPPRPSVLHQNAGHRPAGSRRKKSAADCERPRQL